MAQQFDAAKYDELKELGGGDTSLLQELMEKYLENTPKLISLAEEAFKSGDEDKIDYAVHTMKGSTLSLGITPLGEYLVELNKKTKQRDFEGFENTIAELKQFVKEVETLKTTL